MSWQTEAEKFVAAPVALVDIYLDDQTLRYAIDEVRPQTSAPYKGRILSLPRIKNSLGTISRTYEVGEASLVLADPDRSLREIARKGGLKGRRMRISVALPAADLSEALTVFYGTIYSYKPKPGLQFQIIAQQAADNFSLEYPDAVINLTDFPNAYSGIVGQAVPIIWGTDSSDSGPIRTFMIDTTEDAEKHLVGQQMGKLSVSNVKLNGILKAAGADYSITSAVYGGFTYTFISWQPGIRPQPADKVSCDAAYLVTGSPVGPVEAIRYFLTNWAGYVSADFDASSYADAIAEEILRGYSFDGVMAGAQSLEKWINEIRNEFELDVWRDTETGKVMFRYLGQALDLAAVPSFTDVRDIIAYEPSVDVELIANWIRPAYNYDYVEQNFKNYQFYEDEDSQEAQGGVYKLTPTLYFVRDSGIALDLAGRKVLRQKNPMAFETFTLPLKAFSLLLGSVIKITHFDGLGLLGYQSEYFQVRAMEFDLNSFLVYVTAERVTGFYGNSFILGDEGTYPTWPPADSSQEIYGYLCDETTGEFGNGDEGKALVDG